MVLNRMSNLGQLSLERTKKDTVMIYTNSRPCGEVSVKDLKQFLNKRFQEDIHAKKRASLRLTTEQRARAKGEDITKAEADAEEIEAAEAEAEQRKKDEADVEAKKALAADKLKQADKVDPVEQAKLKNLKDAKDKKLKEKGQKLTEDEIDEALGVGSTVEPDPVDAEPDKEE